MIKDLEDLKSVGDPGPVAGPLSLEVLNERLRAVAHHCDHNRNNLVSIIKQLFEQMERHSVAQTSVSQLVSRLEEKTTKMEERSFSILEKVSESAQAHKSNGYLIRWIMNISGGLFVSNIAALAAFLLNRH